MASEFFIRKRKNSITRKVSLLPRLGIYIDFAGYELVYKRAPWIETFANVVEEKVSSSHFARVMKKQLAEIQFPKGKKMMTINVKTRQKT